MRSDRKQGDPINSERPRGKSASQRKGAADGPSWTPTEHRLRNKLMRQFMTNKEGAGGTSALFRQNYDAIDWSDYP